MATTYRWVRSYRLIQACAIFGAVASVCFDWYHWTFGSQWDDLISAAIRAIAGGAAGLVLGSILHQVRPRATGWVVLAILVALGVWGWFGYGPGHPATVAAAQREAVRRYPQLGVANSPFNREFRARFNRYRQSNPAYFQQTDWPLRLAAECDASLNGAAR